MLIIESNTKNTFGEKGIITEHWDIETNGADLKFLSRINESEGISNTTDQFVLQGVMAQAEIKNRNGRVYPKKVLEKAVKQFIKTYVNENSAAMELNHPDDMSINYERVVGRVTKLWWDGNNVMGECNIGNEGLAAKVRDMSNMGFKVNVSTRGIGSITESIVDDGYEMHAIDIVFRQSAKDATLYKVPKKTNSKIKEDLQSLTPRSRSRVLEQLNK